MRVIFTATADFAVPSLEALMASRHDVLLVVTQQDRPRGRKRELQPTPVKLAAQGLGVEVFQPEKIASEESFERLKSYGPVDALVVVAYGQKIPPHLLEWPPKGVVNVHGSLLPKYRGAAPIQHALISGEKETGVTTMLMDEGWDTGCILLQKSTEITPGETAGELSQRLAKIGADLLVETLDGLEECRISPVCQDESQATMACSLCCGNGVLDWSTSAECIVNTVRGCNPKPGAFTRADGVVIKVWQAEIGESETDNCTPGEVVYVDSSGITIAASEGSVRLVEVQPASRKRMPATEYARGTGIARGHKFDITFEMD